MNVSIVPAALVALITVTACAPKANTEATRLPTSSQFPAAPSRGDRPTEITAANFEIYQDPNGWFALALPKGYEFEPTDQGLTFQSPDQGFGGTIRYLTEQEQDLDQAQLESILKQDLSSQMDEVSWQRSAQPQADGSLRLDWTGLDADGNKLDAVSFIEQHGSTLFLMTAHGINQPYLNYNNDARIIAGTYVVRRNETTSAQESAQAKSSDIRSIYLAAL